MGADVKKVLAVAAMRDGKVVTKLLPGDREVTLGSGYNNNIAVEGAGIPDSLVFIRKAPDGQSWELRLSDTMDAQITSANGSKLKFKELLCVFLRGKRAVERDDALLRRVGKIVVHDQFACAGAAEMEVCQREFAQQARFLKMSGLRDGILKRGVLILRAAQRVVNDVAQVGAVPADADNCVPVGIIAIQRVAHACGGLDFRV